MTDQTNNEDALACAPKTAKSKLLTGAMLAGAITLLAACGDRQPEGQVVAVVNGDEVTLQEVNAALGDAQVPEGEEAQTVRNGALANVINRRLMAGIAREDGIDSTPEFIVRKRQVEEALLVQMLTQSAAAELDAPTAAQIDSFIAENPQMFAERKLIAANQIRFRTPARDDYIEALAEVTNMDQAVAVLNRLGIEFERGNTRIDSGNLPNAMFQRMLEVGTSEPIIVPTPTVVTVSQILQVADAPLTAEQARPVAVNMINQRALAEQLEERLDAAKAEAGIEYQPGYAAVEEDEAGDSGEGVVPALPTAVEETP
ncbi:hypothetical protein [Qipengyuania sp. DGS5-3]|uniref:hypothetical protein n=1 Tax=Qipengyuania sp. DGS5-3 TaxID=3349632 RepID=UPI0036D4159D